MRDPKLGKDVMEYFLDAETYLLLKSTYQNDQRGISGTVAVCHEDLFSDYRKIDGIMVAFTTDQRWWPVGKEPKDKKPELKVTPEQGHQKQIVDEIKFNLPLKDSLFVMPEPVAAPSATNAAKH
jgi:hypothetical protein